jgi:hypothetical protein
VVRYKERKRFQTQTYCLYSDGLGTLGQAKDEDMNERRGGLEGRFDRRGVAWEHGVREYGPMFTCVRLLEEDLVLGGSVCIVGTRSVMRGGEARRTS